jgi:hypothetical protein
MGLDTDDMDEIMMLIGTGGTIEDLSFPITDEVRKAWDEIRAEMARQPGPVTYYPVGDFPRMSKEDIRRLARNTGYRFNSPAPAPEHASDTGATRDTATGGSDER